MYTSRPIYIKGGNMYKALILCLLLVLVGIPAQAQYFDGGYVGVFNDSDGLECNIEDATVGVFSVYLVHVPVLGSGASGIDVIVEIPMCALDANVFMFGPVVEMFPATTTTLQIDNYIYVWARYGSACAYLPTAVIRIDLFGYGLTTGCCEFFVIPMDATRIHGIGCANEDYKVDVATGIINNGTESCDCLYTVPVESTSWGKIKSIYK
jgi:hypothetical protein